MQSLPSAYLPMAQEIKKEKAYSLLKTKKGGDGSYPRRSLRKGSGSFFFPKKEAAAAQEYPC